MRFPPYFYFRFGRKRLSAACFRPKGAYYVAQWPAECSGRQPTTRRKTGNGNLRTGSSFRRPEVASSGPLVTVRVLLDVKRDLMSPFPVAPRPEVVSSVQTVAVRSVYYIKVE